MAEVLGGQQKNHMLSKACCRLNYVPPKDVLKSSCSPSPTYECGLIWKSGLCRCPQVKMRLNWVEVDVSLMTGVLKTRDIWTQTHREKIIGWQRWGLDFYCHNQRSPRIAGNCQKLGERRGAHSPFERARRNLPCAYLDFGLLAHRTLERINFCCREPPSLQEFVMAAQETNTRPQPIISIHALLAKTGHGARPKVKGQKGHAEALWGHDGGVDIGRDGRFGVTI